MKRMHTQEQEQAARDLMMSPTMGTLCQLAQGMPPSDTQDDLKTALASCSMPLIAALDNNRITFENDEDKAMFYGLLCVAIDGVMNGKLKQSVTLVGHH